MKKLLVVLSVLIYGCAAPASLTIPGIERSESVAAKDLRPETEKQDATFSYVLTSDAYAIYRLGDASLSPSATRLLRHRAFEKFGSGGEALNLTIHHLVVYRNLQAQFRQTALGPGLIPALIVGTETREPSGIASTLVNRQAFDSPDREHARAYYTGAENPGRGGVYVVYIDSEMRGKR